MNRTQHPSNNDVIGAPPGMSNDECFALPITRLQYSDGAPAVASYWTHPPLMLGVDGDGEI